MKQIPLQSTPSQVINTIIADKNCILNIYHKSTGLYIDVLVDGEQIVLGRICRDRCRIIRYEYLGFVGDLFFVDTQGSDDPAYTGLGDRFVLLYAFPDEISVQTTTTNLTITSAPPPP